MGLPIALQYLMGAKESEVKIFLKLANLPEIRTIYFI
jgi:hypothetical protein